MDIIGATVAHLHSLLGHDKAAAVLGVAAGDKRECVICRHEDNPTEDTMRAVEAALMPPGRSEED